MKNYLKSFLFLGVGASLILASCGKFHCNDKDKNDAEDFGNEEAMLILDAGYTSEITSELKKPVDFDYITEGVIEYSLNGNKVAKIDFGQGELDAKAKKDKDGTQEECDLAGKKKSDKYKKVITSPLVKLTDCQYIVAGVIEYYKGSILVATVDFGDGTCDNLATKYWPAGSDGNKSWPAGSKIFNLK